MTLQRHSYLIFAMVLFTGGNGIAEEAMEDGRETETKHTAAQIEFFEKKIRPVLADKCYQCHSQEADKSKGGLLLDSREGIRRGGDSGAGVVPGNLNESLLIEAIRYTNKDFAMPPKKEGGKLDATIIQDFETWVKMGAPDPREGVSPVKKADMQEAKKWWAFQIPQKPVVPSVKNNAWSKTESDRFILAALEAKNLKPSADADKLTLIRRVYFDLIGLPPELPEIDAFLKDNSATAYSKVVDRLLASPQFGERWGRHWLDVARYAESSGKDVNINYPHAWRYRDYVIASFNADKPYDQFVKEQVAGDLLPSQNDRQRAEQMIGTGFLAIGTKSLNENNSKQFYLDLADEQIDTVSQAFMGMTIACARCHDHKFDPVSQSEYYALAGIFLSSDTRFGIVPSQQTRNVSDLLELPSNSGLPVVGKPLSYEDRNTKERKLAALKKEQAEFIKERAQERANGKDQKRDTNRRGIQLATQIGQLEAELKSYTKTGQPKLLAMGVQELQPKEKDPKRSGESKIEMRLRQRNKQRSGRPAVFSMIADSQLYVRGELNKPSTKVPRGFPAVFSQSTEPVSKSVSGRKELAEWLISSNNPLTARVMVNRIWSHLFGRGIVESADNFGTSGHKPGNQALLDHLAIRFVEQGWSVKKMIREIVMSHAYQLSSTHDAKAFAADPQNTLIWKMNKRRLEAECIRDTMLAVGRQLQLTPPVGSLIAEAGDGPVGIRQNRGISEARLLNSGDTILTRSVYLPIAREVFPDLLGVFDFADSSVVAGTRETTNVPSQALFMLNSDFSLKQAQKLAERVMLAYPADGNNATAVSFDARLNFAYWLALGRPPNANERDAAMNFLTKFPNDWKKGDNSKVAFKDNEAITAAWISLCRALFACSDFRYLN